MDPATLSIAMTLASQGMRMYADYMDQAANGEHTPEQSKAIADHLRAHIDYFQSLLPKK